MGNGLREKYVQLCVKILSIHQDYIYENQTDVKTIDRIIKSGKEIRVNASLYNKILMMITYAKIIFRYTTSIEKMSAYKDEVKEAEKSIKELYKEIKSYDEDPDNVSVYVRCNKDKIRNIIKDIKKSTHDMEDIVRMMETEVEMTQKNYKVMSKLVKIYIIRSNTMSSLVYSIKTMLKYKE